MDDDRRIIRKQLRIQDSVIKAYLDTYENETIPITIEELCTKCQFKHKDCNPCKAFKNYCRETAGEIMQGVSKWN